MKYVRGIFAVIAVLFLLGLGATYAYYLKGYVKVHITGTEVKRMDQKTPEGEVKPTDVRFIMARTLDGDTRVFRNVDAGWWPPYFKFDSGDVAGDAMSFSKEEPPPVVLVTYYGMRIPMFSLYPNVLGLKLVDKDYEPVPVFNILVLTLTALALIAAGIAFYRLSKWRPFGRKAN